MECSALALLLHISPPRSTLKLYESEVAEPSMRCPSSKAVIENDSDKGLFVLKLKDSAITESINFLKSKGHFPDKIEDSDDEFIFGDDAFDEINAEAEAEAAAEEPAAAEEDAGDMDHILDLQFILCLIVFVFYSGGLEFWIDFEWSGSQTSNCTCIHNVMSRALIVTLLSFKQVSCSKHARIHICMCKSHRTIPSQ